MSINSTAAGASTILARSFGSTTGFASAGNSAATDNIKSIIQQGDLETRRTNFFKNIGARIGYLAKGMVKPDANWEKIAVYMAKTGQPMSVTLDDKGNIQVERQEESAMKRFSQAQQQTITKATGELADLVAKQTSNTANQALRARLETAADSIQFMQAGGLPDPKQPWQYQVKPLRDTFQPFKIALDAKGNETIVDQSKSLFLDLPVDKRPIMQKAIGDWQQAVKNGVFLQDWQVKAKSLMNLGKSVYFELNSINQVVVKENTAANVVPDFLKKDPYPNLGKNLQKWQTDALAFAKAGTAFFLDIDPGTQKLVAKEVNAQSVSMYNKTPSYQRGNTAIGSLMSLIT